MSAVRESFGGSVRPMRRADLLTIEEIEKTTYPFPWSLGIFRDCLQHNYFCTVLDTADGLAGYSVSSVAAGEAHILNFCIRPERQRQHLGTLFLQRLIDEIQGQGVQRIILEVRPSNEAALKLYRQAGFATLGIRRGYYPAAEGREDALVLALELEQPPHRPGAVLSPS